MIFTPDTVRALYGACRLARFDKNGLSFFKPSIDGFWYSFRAAFIVAPLFLALIAIRLLETEVEIDLAAFLSGELSAYVLSWLVFPVVMEALSRSMGCRDNFLGFMIAYNWSLVPQYALFVGVISLGLVGIIPIALSEILSLLVLLWSFFYIGFIAKTALDISISASIGVVFLDFLLGLTLDQIVTS